MSVPIEKLQLRTLLCERVFVKWVDQLGTPFMLGSCLHDNRQNPKFLMRASCDVEGHIHIHFSLTVSIKLAGKRRQMEMLLIVPPDADFASASTPLPISNLDDLSFLDASALHEAGISELEHIILLRFDLTIRGFVITKKKTSATIKPTNSTSSDLIRSLESLSNMKSFSVYIRPNDYAREGLKELHKRLSSTGTDTGPHKTDMMEMYVQEGAMQVDWDRFMYHDRQDTTLPPYTKDPQRLAEVQAPQSPPITFGKETPSVDAVEVTVAETPTRSPIGPSPRSVLHGIFSSSIEEPLDSEVDLGDMEEDSRHIEMDFEVDSEEEYLANLNSRELSQQLRQDSAVPKSLQSEFVEWVNRAMTINTNVYEHKRLITKLSILGDSVRMSNARIFDATRPWCSAIFFYEPTDSDNTHELWDRKNRWLIADMAKLIEWANKRHRGAEMSSLLISDFVKLGSAARNFALQAGCDDRAEYNLQKSVCVVRVLVEFGKPGAIASGANSKPVSQKRGSTLETHSNVSKRVMIASQR